MGEHFFHPLISDVVYGIKSAEDMDYEESFDVIFCNSTFQWFKDPEKAIKNCNRALRKNGRISIQTPAKKIYCSNFVEAIEMMKRPFTFFNRLPYHPFRRVNSHNLSICQTLYLPR